MQADLAPEVDRGGGIGHPGPAVADVEFNVDVDLRGERAAHSGELAHGARVVRAHADAGIGKARCK